MEIHLSISERTVSEKKALPTYAGIGLILILTISAALVSFSSLLAPYALSAWPVVFAGSLSGILFSWRRENRLTIFGQLPFLMGLISLVAAGTTQALAANGVPSGQLPLHALPGQELIFLLIGASAAFGLTWLSLAETGWGPAGAALGAAALFSSVAFFRVSAVIEVGYAFSTLAGFTLLGMSAILKQTTPEGGLQFQRNTQAYWKWALIPLAVLGAAVMLSPVPNQSLVYVLYILVLVGLAALAAVQIRRNRGWNLAAETILALGAGLPVLLGLVKTAGIFVEFGPSAGLAYRLHPSEMGGANLLARSILIAAPFGLALLLKRQPRKMRGGLDRAGLALLEALILAVMLYARSYEGFFAWLVGLFIFALLASWPRIHTVWKRMTSKPAFAAIVIITGVIMIAAVLYAGARVGYSINPYSFNGRFQHWVGAFTAWKDHPLFGGGPDNEYLYAQSAGDLTILGESQEFLDDPLYVIRYHRGLLLVHAHNLLLETAAFSGLVGLLALLGMLAALVWTGVKIWKQTRPELKLLAAACLAGIAGDLAWGLLDVIRETPPFFSFPIWLVIGLLLSLPAGEQTEVETSVPSHPLLGTTWLTGIAVAAGLLLVLLPSITSNRYSSGFLAFQEHRWEDAARNFRQAAAFNPLNAQYAWMQSKAELELEQWEQAEASLQKANKLKQGYSPYLAQAGWLAWMRGNLQAANTYFEAALENDPLESWTSGLYANLGLLKASQGKPDEASVDFARSLELHPELATADYWVKAEQPDGSVRVTLAADFSPEGGSTTLHNRIMAQLGMADISATHFDPSPAQDRPLYLENVFDTLHASYLAAESKGEANAHLILAAESEAARLAGLEARAAAAFLDYQALRPDSAYGYQGLGTIYASTEDGLAEAQAWLEKALEVSPKNLDVLRILAQVQLDRGDVEGAGATLASTTPIASSNAFQLRLFDVDLMKSLVQWYRASGDVEKIRQTLEGLAAIQGTADDYLTLARENQNRQDWETAAKNCWKAYDALTERWVRPYDSRLWDTAICISQSGQTDEQVEQRSATAESGFTQALFLGHTSRLRGENERGEAFYRLAAQARRNESAPHYYLGELYTAMGRTTEAEYELEQAAELDEHESLPLLSLGRLYEDTGNLDAAQEAYLAAVDRTPGSEEAQLALANVYLRTGQPSRAIPHLAVVKEINAHPASSANIDLVASLGEAVLSENVTEGFVKGAICDLNGVQTMSIFMHPVSSAEYTLNLPVLDTGEDLWLRFKVGTQTGSWDQAGDGVTFKAVLQGEGRDRVLYSVYLDPKHNLEERDWEGAQIRLNEYAGQEVRLTLMTDGGEAGDLQYDWACWGSPSILVEETTP